MAKYIGIFIIIKNNFLYNLILLISPRTYFFFLFSLASCLLPFAYKFFIKSLVTFENWYNYINIFIYMSDSRPARSNCNSNQIIENGSIHKNQDKSTIECNEARSFVSNKYKKKSM